MKEIESVTQFGINSEDEKLATLAETKSTVKANTTAEKDNQVQEFCPDKSYQLVSNVEFLATSI